MGSSKMLILSAILACLILLAPLAGPARSDEIRWHTNYDAAVKEARETNRPIFFDVYKEACPPCHYLDTVVYRDPAVAKFINDNYVAVKLNGELQTVRIRNNEVIARFPTLLFITPDQRILDTNVGALDAAPFLELAKKMFASHLALNSRPKVGSTPFQAGVRVGPSTSAAWTTVFGGQQIVPPSDGSFSFQPLTLREQRTLRAREILFQAEENYRKQQWLTCIDLSRSLIVYFPELPESSAARQLEQSIGPDRLERLGKDLTEKLGQVYWELAQEKIRQNQLSEAAPYMEKIIQLCPGTPHVPAAQEFLRSVTQAANEQEAAQFRP
jgi:hypothetical protein